ncbi:MAG: Fe-S cluster assembly ATP-binding protein, partial [Thermosediminibacterales bacterium]|nr:Fe-S cluster assembly ATP-binding protein [Thermosediminibacterales bacterium]
MLELNNISIDLNVQNGNGKTRILNNLSFKFEQGKFYCITGPNGGGKTSIAKVIMGIY